LTRLFSGGRKIDQAGYHQRGGQQDRHYEDQGRDGRRDRIELRGFGVFNVKPRKTGIGRNPRTGAEVSIPPGKAVRFKPGKELQTLH